MYKEHPRATSITCQCCSEHVQTFTQAVCQWRSHCIGRSSGIEYLCQCDPALDFRTGECYQTILVCQCCWKTASNETVVGQACRKGQSMAILPIQEEPSLWSRKVTLSLLWWLSVTVKCRSQPSERVIWYPSLDRMVEGFIRTSQSSELHSWAWETYINRQYSTLCSMLCLLSHGIVNMQRYLLRTIRWIEDTLQTLRIHPQTYVCLCCDRTSRI